MAEVREIGEGEYREFLRGAEERFLEASEGLASGGSKGAAVSGVEFLQAVEMHRRYVKTGREAYIFGLVEEEKVGGSRGAKRGRGSKVLMAGVVYRMGKLKVGGKIFCCARGPVGDYRYFSEWSRGVEGVLRRRGGAVLVVSPSIRFSKKGSSGVASARPVVTGEPRLCSVVTSAYPQKNLSLEDLGIQPRYKAVGEYGQVKWIYTLDPRGKSEEELFRSFRKGHKLSIRYATERYGMRVRELRTSELSTLKELVDEAGEKHEFRAASEEYFREMKEAFSEKVKFLVAEMPRELAESGKTLAEYSAEGGKKVSVGKKELSGEMVATAGAMFIEYGGELVYLFSGSREKYKKYGGPHLIQWEMIKYAREKGLKYNFYGTKPVEGDGVHAFKTGFHGEVEEYIGTFMKGLNLLGKLYVAGKKYREYGEVA